MAGSWDQRGEYLSKVNRKLAVFHKKKWPTSILFSRSTQAQSVITWNGSLSTTRPSARASPNNSARITLTGTGDTVMADTAMTGVGVSWQRIWPGITT